MGLFAGDIKADPTLAANLGAVGKPAENDIRGLYDRIRKNFQTDSMGRGVKPGSYAPERFNVAQGQSEAGLRGSLEGVLGDTTYSNFKADRGYNENAALAKEIGALNKPNSLEAILGALGMAGRVGGQVYGARSAAPRARQPLAYESLTGDGFGNDNWGSMYA